MVLTLSGLRDLTHLGSDVPEARSDRIDAELIRPGVRHRSKLGMARGACPVVRLIAFQ